MATETSRLSATEIFGRVEQGAEEELERPTLNLLISAVSAGLAMGISGLAVAVLLRATGGDGAGEVLAYLGYPVGFLIVIIGRQQLFTENTLFPVALVLKRRSYLARTAVLWGVVLLGNVLGTLLFALLATRTPAVAQATGDELVGIGVGTGSGGFTTVFWTAIVAGWLIALVAWLVTACTDTIGQIALIVIVTYFIGVGHFAHSIAGSGEVLTAVLAGELPFTSYVTWFSAAVLGNTVGGVVIVALFNYGQVHADGSAD